MDLVGAKPASRNVSGMYGPARLLTPWARLQPAGSHPVVLRVRGIVATFVAGASR